MVDGGQIPLATEIDITGKPIPIAGGGLKQVEERTKMLKIAMATLTGQRSPLLSKSPRASNDNSPSSLDQQNAGV